MVLQRSLIAIAALSLAACGSLTDSKTWWNPPEQRISDYDLNHFKWDCPHAAEQAAFLRFQYSQTSPFPYDDMRRAIIQKNLNEIRTWCPDQAAKPVSCTHVREDMTRGSSQAVVCNNSRQGLGPAERPVVNRWDPLVDLK